MKHDPCVEPNVVAYTAAISACERSGQWEMAIQVRLTLVGLAALTALITLVNHAALITSAVF